VGVYGVLMGSLGKKMRKYQHFCVAAFLLCLSTMHSALAATSAESPSLMVSKDGSFVLDMQSKLAWSRCVEGMQWNGQACVGEAALVTHGQALTLAGKRAKSDDACWRVPSTKELQHLVSKDEVAANAKTLFPSAPPDWYWTASASVDNSSVNPYDYKNIQRGVTGQNANRLAFLHGWAVNVQTGETRGDAAKTSKLPVRLVCAAG
jgi:hypothetical protein